MSTKTTFDIPIPVAMKANHPAIAAALEHGRKWSRGDFSMRYDELTDDVVADLVTAAKEAGDGPFERVVTGIQASMSGDFSKPIPRFSAALPMIEQYLLRNALDGWVYRRKGDGHTYAYLVTGIRIMDGRNPGDERLEITLASNNGESSLGYVTTSIILSPQDVARKRIAVILGNEGLLVGTPELKAAYEAEIESYRALLTEGFAEQYRYTGQPTSRSYNSDGREPRTNHKVIHDIAPADIKTFTSTAPTMLGHGRGDADEVRPVPIHPTLRVFDLVTQTFLWVNAADLTEYNYDHGLRHKLVLPAAHADLLDILTEDVETFTADVIEGKSAGNVILCKGPAGVGKTLSAEVYSELIDRPLYSIHSGTLGTDAKSIRENLEMVFKRAKRWNAVLLLDEADVFVLERGESINQNAIVAEFLRTLEYFDGLMFMTTNRADNIDDAIISRCAAIIDYETPSAVAAKSIWEVQAANNGVTIPADLLDDLVKHIPKATGRDIKMLLRLALRVSKKHNEPLSLDLFRRCTMFRAVEFQVGESSGVEGC